MLSVPLYFPLRGHRLGYGLGQFVKSMVGGLVSLDELYIQALIASLALFGTFPPLQCPRSFLPYFILLFNYYSCVCSYLLLHPCCFHARGILCGIQTSCMRSPFPTVHTRCSLVFPARCYISIEHRNFSTTLLYFNLSQRICIN